MNNKVVKVVIKEEAKNSEVETIKIGKVAKIKVVKEDSKKVVKKVANITEEKVEIKEGIKNSNKETDLYVNIKNINPF